MQNKSYVCFYILLFILEMHVLLGNADSFVCTLAYICQPRALLQICITIVSLLCM